MQARAFQFPECKPRLFRRFARIIATDSHFPEKRVANEEIARACGLPSESAVVARALGVQERRVAGPGVEDSDLLAAAAGKCLRRAGLSPGQLHRIIVTKYLGDNVLPMTAVHLQEKLGCSVAVQAFDVEGGINSFLVAVDLATRYINSGDELVLIASGGIVNEFVSKTDPRVAFLFGDGAACVLVGTSAEPRFLASYFYTNHTYHDLALAIGLQSPLPPDIFERRDYGRFYDTYAMGNWKKAQDFYRLASKTVCERLLAQCGLTPADIDLVLVTENNRQIVDLTLDAIDVPRERSLSLLGRFGNTMSAMLPSLLDFGFSTGRIRSGMNVMLISHGEGISGGGMIYRA